jgi:hypothetical protein
VDANDVNHCSNDLAVRGPWRKKKGKIFFFFDDFTTNHSGPKMCFIDCWWLSFSTIIYGMIFFFFEHNYFKKFQYTFIGIFKKILTFETFML